MGISAVFAFGQFLNEDTLFASVRALPAAACVTFACDTGKLHLETYRQVSIRHRSDTAEARRAVPQLLCAAVESQTAEGRVGLSLSGGLDARTILGIAPNPSSIQTVSVGVQGSIDHRGAAELARIVGAPHHAHILDERFLQSFETHLREMILLTDGHYLDQGIVMPTLQTYRDLGIDVLLRGHGGELLHMDKAYAYSMDSEGLGASNGDIEGWLYRHLSAYMLEDVPLKVFSAERRALARQALDAAIAKQPEVDVPAQRVWQLFLTERLHRETALSMHKFWCFCRVRLPYLDPQFVDAVMELAPRDKIGAGLQCEILRAYRPEFLVVPNSNTGARPDAGEWAAAFARLRLRAYARLRVPGYQPYERLGLWLSRQLRPMVERILLGESALDRGVFDADAVKQLLASTSTIGESHVLHNASSFSNWVSKCSRGPCAGACAAFEQLNQGMQLRLPTSCLSGSCASVLSRSSVVDRDAPESRVKSIGRRDAAGGRMAGGSPAATGVVTTHVSPAATASRTLFWTPRDNCRGATATHESHRNGRISGTRPVTVIDPLAVASCRSLRGGSAPARTSVAFGLDVSTCGQTSLASHSAACTFGAYEKTPENTTWAAPGWCPILDGRRNVSTSIPFAMATTRSSEPRRSARSRSLTTLVANACRTA